MRIDEFTYTPFYSTSAVHPYKMEWTKDLKLGFLIQFDLTKKKLFYQARKNVIFRTRLLSRIKVRCIDHIKLAVECR